MRQKFTCNECKCTFTPTFWRWLCAPHAFDIWRYMKCPKCGKKTWMKREKK